VGYVVSSSGTPGERIRSLAGIERSIQVLEFDTLRQKMLMENGFYSMEEKYFV
jgi:hypothetical protein